MNAAGRAPGSRPRRLPQRSAGVEDEHRNAGTNGGRQVEAGQVLAMPSGCAVMSVATAAATAAATVIPATVIPAAVIPAVSAVFVVASY